MLNSVVDIYHCTHFGPVEEPLCFRCGQVDTSMAHRLAKVSVPGRAVQAVATIKVHHVGHIGEVVVGSAHIIVAQFDPDVILAGGCGRVCQACRDRRYTYQLLSLVGSEELMGQVYVYPAHVVAGDR